MVIFIALILFQNYTYINSMYRVLLKIDKVQLKIKQTVALHILIRKQHRYFTHSKNQLLRNGQAKLTNSSQFFIDANNPKFQIEIYLLSGETKKKGGSVLLNLKNYSINDSHRIIEMIKKTPVSHSSLLIDFVYMPSECALQNEGLISVHKLQEMRHKKHLKEITDEHEKLVYHNGRLHEEIKKLKEKNNDLNRETRTLEQSLTNREEQYSLQLQNMKKEKEKSFINLQNQQKIIAEIVQHINQTGTNSLKKEMEKIIKKPGEHQKKG